MAATRDPSPAEIEAICREIQSEWSASEKMKRLRPDLRPMFSRCDGEKLEIDAAAYNRHHSEHELLIQEQAR